MANRFSKKAAISIIKNLATIIILMVAVSADDLGFAGSKIDNPREENDMRSKTIQEALKEHTERLMSISGVVGTAQGSCGEKECIKVFVIEKTPALIRQVPKTIEGFPVDLVETDEVHAYPEK